MKANVTKTANREYWTVERNGMWTAHYQPINQKTGKTWQAWREITAGRNVYRGNGQSVIHNGKPSPDWTFREFPDGITLGFATESDALTAIASEKAKSGK